MKLLPCLITCAVVVVLALVRAGLIPAGGENGLERQERSRQLNFHSCVAGRSCSINGHTICHGNTRRVSCSRYHCNNGRLRQIKSGCYTPSGCMDRDEQMEGSCQKYKCLCDRDMPYMPGIKMCFNTKIGRQRCRGDNDECYNEGDTYTVRGYNGVKLNCVCEEFEGALHAYCPY